MTAAARALPACVLQWQDACAGLAPATGSLRSLPCLHAASWLPLTHPFVLPAENRLGTGQRTVQPRLLVHSSVLLIINPPLLSPLAENRPGTGQRTWRGGG